ncbi:hypothetical protein ABT369_14355 [Dactylosporangium sp. NPDC000244]|uniref:hypothetical protein n=1 Tax=Dactylosporangium sp. NPDC000244 TaxID=3154365 RepID=UPI0033329C91
MRWAWVVAPSVLVGAAGALVHAFVPGGYVVFGLIAVTLIGLDQLLTDVRRREEPEARPGWEFFAPRGLVAARAGRAFALAVTLMIAALLLTGDPLGWAVAAALAAPPALVGVQLSVRLAVGASVLRLSPDGVEVRGRRYPWERIEAVELNGDRANPRLDLLVAGRRHPVTLRPSGVDASLLFLTDLLGYYQSHARVRGAIGDPVEAGRVHGLLLGARLAAGLHGGPRPILAAG